MRILCLFLLADIHPDRAPRGAGEAAHAAGPADVRARELPQPGVQPDLLPGGPALGRAYRGRQGLAILG